MKNFSLIISVILHPLLLATYVCVLLFFGIPHTIYDYLTPFYAKWRICIVVFLFSFIFPVLNIYLLVRLKRIPNITLSNQKDRTFPLFITALFYFGLFYLLIDINIWSSVKLFILGGAIAILLTTLINLKYKISAHMVGLGGVLGIFISISYLIQFDMTAYYMITIILAGIVGVARLFLQEHTPAQLYWGFFLGLTIQSGLFFALQNVTFV